MPATAPPPFDPVRVGAATPARFEERSLAVQESCHSIVRIAERFGLDPEAERVRDRLRDADLGLLVLVAGEGNFGKSSLINAICGKQVAPVSILPKTTKVDVYRLSTDGSEWAELRHRGQVDTERMSLEEAAELCEVEERRLIKAANDGMRASSEIVETIWYHTGLSIDPSVCLVDTPGLAQFAVSDSEVDGALVKGLGATYSVDEVWALWYHRADLVLWAFQANGLESKETHRSLTQVTKVFQKPIVPIATKADLVPTDQHGKIHEVFDRHYRPLLGSQCLCPPLLTVTGGKSPQVGLGIDGLRDRLTGMAPYAKERKLSVSEAFARDLSIHLEGLLTASAGQLVDNLRVIADAGDEVALFAMARTREAIQATRTEAEDHIAQKFKGLDDIVGPLFDRLKKLHEQGVSKDQLQLIGEEEIRRYLRLDTLDKILDQSLSQVGSSVSAQAEAICSAKELERVRISASGAEMRSRFTMLVKVQVPRSRLEFTFPRLDFADMEYGFADLLVDLAKFVYRTATTVAKGILKGIFG